MVRVSCRSGIDFVSYWLILSSVRTLFYSEPEAGVRVTEMIAFRFLCRRPIMQLLLSNRLPRPIYRHRCLPCLCVYFRRRIFSVQTQAERKKTASARNGRQESGADLWERFLDRVSWALRLSELRTRPQAELWSPSSAGLESWRLASWRNLA